MEHHEALKQSPFLGPCHKSIATLKLTTAQFLISIYATNFFIILFSLTLMAANKLNIATANNLLRTLKSKPIN
ncbi:MAG: hypothetical protein ACJAYG_002474 [Oceanicoccus sp.]|jgi:hypothetical protein